MRVPRAPAASWLVRCIDRGGFLPGVLACGAPRFATYSQQGRAARSAEAVQQACQEEPQQRPHHLTIRISAGLETCGHSGGWYVAVAVDSCWLWT